MFWLRLFWVLGGLLLVQSVWSLADGYKFLTYLRRSHVSPLGSYHPPVALIVPCKGLDIGLERNLAAYLTQDYPDYEVIFVVSTDDDPALPVLRRAIDQPARKETAVPKEISIVVAGISEFNGEKVHNLLAALRRVSSEVEILAFADSDACPPSGWLAALVSPLSDPAVTVSSGFRWYLPGRSFASQLQAAWDSVIATMLGDHRRNIPWGGSMAIRVEDFQRMKVAEKYWQGTVSDDYGVARAVREARGWVRFEPRCLVPTESESRVRSVLAWTNRQIILTRVYAPRLWCLGLVSFWLFAVGILTGVAALVSPSLPPSVRLLVAALLAAILALSVAKGRLRLIAAGQACPQHRERLRSYGGCYWQLALVTPWVMLWNFTSAAIARRIEWRGTVYELKSRTKISIIRRFGPGEHPPLSGEHAGASPDGGKYSARG